MRYEMIREIYNKCSGNQMRDVFVSEVETDDPLAYVEKLLEGRNVQAERSELPDGTIVVDADAAGLKQRFTFSPD